LGEQEEIRRFLLGDLAEGARARLEDRFLSDAALFERVEDAENDLVDDFVAGRLGGRERARFENYYLAQTENRAKVAAARVLRGAQTGAKGEKSAAETSFLQSIRGFLAAWRFAPLAGAAAVLLFVAAGSWFALRSAQTGEIAQLPTPEPTIRSSAPSPTAAPPADANFSVDLNQNAARPSPTAAPTANAAAPKETPHRIEPKPSPVAPAPQTITLALVAGLVRGDGGAANKLILPKKAAAARLTFDLPAAKNYRDLQARIETVAGAGVWSGKIKSAADRAAIVLPAGTFADEDYLLIVSGANEAGERRDFAQFYFNSERK
jgi:hypothetical protein